MNLSTIFHFLFHTTVLQYTKSKIQKEITFLFICSFLFCWIRIRNNNSWSGSRQKFRIHADPDTQHCPHHLQAILCIPSWSSFFSSPAFYLTVTLVRSGPVGQDCICGPLPLWPAADRLSGAGVGQPAGCRQFTGLCSANQSRDHLLQRPMRKQQWTNLQYYSSPTNQPLKSFSLFSREKI